MTNEKVLTVIDGYKVIKLKENGKILLRSPLGANLTLPVEVALKLGVYLNDFKS